MKNIEKVSKEIIAEVILADILSSEKVSQEKALPAKTVVKTLPDATPDTPETSTSIPQEDISEATELAAFVRDKTDSLLSEANLALENLSGKGKASVLESKDDFKSLLLRLKQMKRKLNVV